MSFGKDGESVPISNLSTHDLEVNPGSVTEANSTEGGASYLVSVSPDPNYTHHSFNVPSVPVQFDSLSLWLDASDSILDKAPYTLWVDANDTSTIVTDAGTNELVSWANKTDPAIKLHSGAHKPNSGASINGSNAINFDYSPNKEQIFAKKNGTIDWNPAGVNGATTGTVSDIAVFMALQADTFAKNKYAL